MFRNILVAIDGTPSSGQALKVALDLARLTSASVTALSIEEKLPIYAASVGEVQETKHEMDTFFARIQAAAVEQAAEAGVKLKTVVRAGSAAPVIARFAGDGGFDLIVIGADGQGSLGRTADKVADIASCSVLIARLPVFGVQVQDIMTKDVTTVTPTTPLTAVAEMLLERGLKALPVVDKDQVVGIITGGDLLRRAGMGLRLTLQRTAPPNIVTDQQMRLAAEGRTVADIMTKPAITVTEHTPALAAARLMVDKHIKRLPVVDDQGRLVGIVSRLDILAAMASAARSADTLPAPGMTLPQKAGDIMFRQVLTVTPDAPLNEVINKLVATPLRRVVVVDDLYKVVGIIVDSDLLAQLSPSAPGGILSSLVARLSHHSVAPLNLSGTAADVMVRDVYTVGENTSLVDVIETMLEKRVKRLVVVDEEGRLLGMVDRQSILHSIAGQGQ